MTLGTFHSEDDPRSSEVSPYLSYGSPFKAGEVVVEWFSTQTNTVERFKRKAKDVSPVFLVKTFAGME